MKRFHVIQNIPSPYRLHLFNEMWRQLQALDIEFHVHFMSDMSRGHAKRPLSWRNPKIDFPHTYWPDYGFGQYHFNPGMLVHVWRSAPDFLLVSSTFDTFTGICASFLCRKSTKCAWNEGNTKTPGKMEGGIGWLKRRVFANCQFIAVPGIDAKRYVAMHQARTRLKMPTCVYLPNLIDETRFKPRSGWSLDEIARTRDGLGVEPEERLAITPARLSPVKGLLPYVKQLTPELLKGWRIVIFGQGELKGALESLICERGLQNRVFIRDYVSYEEMPKMYAAADLFLLPSLKDPNPLSVIEALHSGLPVAVTDRAGNVDEAVTEGQNGWILPVGDEKGFAQALYGIFSTPTAELAIKGHVSKTHNAQFWNTQEAVRKFFVDLGLK